MHPLIPKFVNHYFNLKKKNNSITTKEAIQHWCEEKSHQIDFKFHESEPLVSLNYNMINTPQIEDNNYCRSLLVEYLNEEPYFRVVSRSFKRFFNFQEYSADKVQFPCYAIEKYDGTLIDFFKYKDKWCLKTKKTFFGEGFINNLGFTFAERIWQIFPKLEEALNILEKRCSAIYVPIVRGDIETPIFSFEYVGPLNKIVTDYKEEKLVFLGVWDKNSTAYDYVSPQWFEAFLETCKINYSKDFTNFLIAPNVTPLVAWEEVDQLLSTKPDDFEGFILLNPTTFSRVKVKSDRYLAMSKMFKAGNVLTDEDMFDIIEKDMQDDLVAMYPHYQERVLKLSNFFKEYYDNCKKAIEHIRFTSTPRSLAHFRLKENNFPEYVKAAVFADFDGEGVPKITKKVLRNYFNP